MIIGDHYMVDSRNDWTNQIGQFVGFTRRGWATLKFGRKGSSAFKMTNLIHMTDEGGGETARFTPVQRPREDNERTNNVERVRPNVRSMTEDRGADGDNRIETITRNTTDELCRAFEGTLRIALDHQREKIEAVLQDAVERKRRERVRNDAQLEKRLDTIERAIERALFKDASEYME